MDALQRDKVAINGIRTVVEWCDARSLDVVFTRIHGGEYDANTKTITVSGRASPESQLFILLHEVGHHLIDTCGTSRARCSKGYSLPGTNDNSMHFKVDTIEEEFEAWDRGRRLAKRLGIKLNSEKFNAYKVSSIKSYLQWAVQ